MLRGTLVTLGELLPFPTEYCHLACILTPPSALWHSRQINSPISGTVPGTVLKMQRAEIHPLVLQSYVVSGSQKNIKWKISNTFPLPFLLLLKLLQREGMPYITRTLIPPYTQATTSIKRTSTIEKQCTVDRDVYIQNGKMYPCLTDSFLLFSQFREFQKQDLVCLGLGMRHMCLVLWRKLNNCAVYKYLHSLIVFGQALLGWVTRGHVPFLLSDKLLMVNRFPFCHSVANGCSFSLVTSPLQNGTSLGPACLLAYNSSYLKGCRRDCLN